MTGTAGPDRVRVLVVDDDPDLRGYLVRVLRSQCPFIGTVLECARGDRALVRMRDGDVDGLITDVNLPGLDGIDLCRAIERELGPDVPMLIVSGESSRTSDAYDFARGAANRAFLEKPFNASTLSRAVTAVFQAGDGVGRRPKHEG